MRSARAAAADKSAINESRSVEHVAEYEELDDGAPEWVEVAKTPGAGSSRKRQVVVETPGPGAAKIARRGLKSQ